jgi:hypothetical protein
MVETFIITGDTWGSREEFKKLDGRWVPHLHAWFVPTAHRTSVARLSQVMGYDVQRVTLPIDVLFPARERLAQRAAFVSRMPSPIPS